MRGTYDIFLIPMPKSSLGPENEVKSSISAVFPQDKIKNRVTLSFTKKNVVPETIKREFKDAFLRF